MLAQIGRAGNVFLRAGDSDVLTGLLEHDDEIVGRRVEPIRDRKS